MPALSRRDSSVFAHSPYAAELERVAASGRFSAGIEAEYLRQFLQGRRALIRVACTVGLLLSIFRATEVFVTGLMTPSVMMHAAAVVIASAALTAISWTPVFERVYLPASRVLVPLRNTLAGIAVAVAASSGQLEVLMLMPLLVMGPFFFLGLSFRLGLLTVALAFSSFGITALWLDLALPVLLRSTLFLLLMGAACAIAARYLEKWSRTSFLERRLIAELAEHDALTGLKNRRIFDEYLQRLWQQAIDEGRTLAIVLVDVDHFKAYNDLYGHQAGDEALRRVAQTLQKLVARPTDVLGRYGGEEFAAVLYDIDAHEAEVIAERMRIAVKELALEQRGTRPMPEVTISVGVAVIEPSADRRLRGALQLADQALYDAKEGGRDRVELLDRVAHGALVTGVFSAAIRARAGG